MEGLPLIPNRVLAIASNQEKLIAPATRRAVQSLRAAHAPADVTELHTLLDLVPMCMERLPDGFEVAPWVVDLLGEHPKAAFAFTISHSDPDRLAKLAPLTESIFASEGGLLKLYFRWMHALKLRFPSPASFYRSALISNPLGGIPFADEAKDEILQRDILRWVAKNYRESSGAAWAYTVLAKKDPTDFLPLISMEPRYLYAAAVSGRLVFDLEELPADLAPLWLCTLAKAKRLNDPVEVKRRLIEESPVWALELLLEEEDGDPPEEWIEQIVAALQSQGRSLMNDLAGDAIRTLIDGKNYDG